MRALGRMMGHLLARHRDAYLVILRTQADYFVRHPPRCSTFFIQVIDGHEVEEECRENIANSDHCDLRALRSGCQQWRRKPI